MSSKEALKWRAEEVVRTAVENTPQYKKAVRQAMGELKKAQKAAQKTMRRK